MRSPKEYDLMELLRRADGTSLQVSPVTEKAYRSIWSQFIASLGGKSVRDAAPADVGDYLESLGLTARAGAIGRPRLGRSSYQDRAAQLLARAYRGLVQLNGCHVNPAEKFALRYATTLGKRAPSYALRNKKSSSRKNAIDRILAAAESKITRSYWKTVRNIAMVALALDVAAKPSELAELTVRSLSNVGTDRCTLTIGRGSRRRQLLLASRTSDRLDAWLQLHACMKVPASVLFPSTAPASSRRSVRALCPAALYKICRGILEEAGLQYAPGETPAGFTMLRNTALVSHASKGRRLTHAHQRSGNQYLENTKNMLKWFRPVPF